MKKTSKLTILKIFREVAALLPMFVLVIVNWEFYTKTTASKIAIGFGMVIGLIFFVLKVLSRLPKNIKGVMWSGIFCGLGWGLKAIIVDLPIFLTAWFIGSLLAEIFNPFINKLEKEIKIEEQATVTANEVVEQITKMSGGGGRV